MQNRQILCDLAPQQVIHFVWPIGPTLVFAAETFNYLFLGLQCQTVTTLCGHKYLLIKQPFKDKDYNYHEMWLITFFSLDHGRFPCTYMGFKFQGFFLEKCLIFFKNDDQFAVETSKNVSQNLQYLYICVFSLLPGPRPPLVWALARLKVEEVFCFKEPEPKRVFRFSLVRSIFWGAKVGDSNAAEKKRGNKNVTYSSYSHRFDINKYTAPET